MLNYEQKANILSSSVSKSGMGVTMKRCRFPMIGKVQQKITLVSNVDGMFMNIGFVSGIENTIHGNIADALLDRFPDVFEVVKINGRKFANQIKDEKDKLKSEILSEIQKDFELVKKGSKGKDPKPTARDRK